MKATETVEELFQRNTTGYPSESDCWIWLQSKSGKRCGSTLVAGKHIYSHRLSYIHFVGPIPEGKQIHHTCGKPLCANPRHLMAVTREEHQAIDPKYARKNVTACPRGHAYTPENTKRTKQKDPSNGSVYYRRSCRTCHRLGGQRRRAEIMAFWNASKKHPKLSPQGKHRSDR